MRRSGLGQTIQSPPGIENKGQIHDFSIGSLWPAALVHPLARQQRVRLKRPMEPRRGNDRNRCLALRNVVSVASRLVRLARARWPSPPPWRKTCPLRPGAGHVDGVTRPRPTSSGRSRTGACRLTRLVGLLIAATTGYGGQLTQFRISQHNSIDALNASMSGM